MSKHIAIIGAVYSGTGKGICAASIGLLLKQRGHSIQILKLDGYLNTSASLLAPKEHGETYITNDGKETDLDLGHYERLLGIEVGENNICTAGNLYKELIQEQEEGRWLGQTIQTCTQFTGKIQKRLLDLGEKAEIVITEVGGTCNDLESGPYLEAIRQFKQQYKDDILIVMVAPILWISTIKEFKTKPLQNGVKDLQRFGLQPDILFCRVDRPVPEEILDKVSNLTNVPRTSIFDAPDVQSIYQVPIDMYDRHVDDLIADKFHLPRNGCRIHKYRDLVEKYITDNGMLEIEIGIAGKYENCDEAYLSLKEALYHAAVANNVKVKIRWINANLLEDLKDMRGIWKHFDGVSGIIVPGGFGARSSEGKLKAIRYAREKKIPFLGICLGLQCAVIEIARDIGIEDANSIEFDKDTKNPVIHFVEGQENIRKKCGTMRLGAFDCELEKDSLARSLYKKKLISERHRHRYEVNAKYEQVLAEAGLKVSGRNPETGLIEVMELSQKLHPYFLGTQAHPEFKSQLGNPSPLFNGLIASAIQYKAKMDTKDKTDTK